MYFQPTYLPAHIPLLPHTLVLTPYPLISLSVSFARNEFNPGNGNNEEEEDDDDGCSSRTDVLCNSFFLLVFGACCLCLVSCYWNWRWCLSTDFGKTFAWRCLLGVLGKLANQNLCMEVFWGIHTSTQTNGQSWSWSRRRRVRTRRHGAEQDQDQESCHNGGAQQLTFEMVEPRMT